MSGGEGCGPMKSAKSEVSCGDRDACLLEMEDVENSESYDEALNGAWDSKEEGLKIMGGCGVARGGSGKPSRRKFDLRLSQNVNKGATYRDASGVYRKDYKHSGHGGQGSLGYHKRSKSSCMISVFEDSNRKLKKPPRKGRGNSTLVLSSKLRTLEERMNRIEVLKDSGSGFNLLINKPESQEGEFDSDFNQKQQESFYGETGPKSNKENFDNSD
jgi:hypothetical protein